MRLPSNPLKGGPLRRKIFIGSCTTAVVTWCFPLPWSPDGKPLIVRRASEWKKKQERVSRFVAAIFKKP